MIFNIRNRNDVDLLAKATEGKIVGLTSGCYDLFHDMHNVYLNRCARMCDILIVGLDSDDLVRQWKGPSRPIVPEHQRLSMLANTICVHATFIMGSLDDFMKAVVELKVKKIFKNQAIKPEECIGREHAQVITVPDIGTHVSTTGIIEQIKLQVMAKNAEEALRPAAAGKSLGPKRNKPTIGQNESDLNRTAPEKQFATEAKKILKAPKHFSNGFIVATGKLIDASGISLSKPKKANIAIIKAALKEIENITEAP